MIRANTFLSKVIKNYVAFCTEPFNDYVPFDMRKLNIKNIKVPYRVKKIRRSLMEKSDIKEFLPSLVKDMMLFYETLSINNFIGFCYLNSKKYEEAVKNFIKVANILKDSNSIFTPEVVLDTYRWALYFLAGIFLELIDIYKIDGERIKKLDYLVSLGYLPSYEKSSNISKYLLEIVIDILRRLEGILPNQELEFNNYTAFITQLLIFYYRYN